MLAIARVHTSPTPFPKEKKIQPPPEAMTIIISN